ncbi:MAG: ATP-binding protein [Microcoleaceae cyanobacterium]
MADLCKSFRESFCESLVVPAQLESLDQIAQYVRQVGKQANLDIKKINRLRLAVDEIVTNIILYGYSDANTEKVLELTSHSDPKGLALSIEDMGIPFDPTQHQIPDNLDQPLEEREIGGLGIYLARTNVDQMFYERLGDRNRNTFVMYY